MKYYEDIKTLKCDMVEVDMVREFLEHNEVSEVCVNCRNHKKVDGYDSKGYPIFNAWYQDKYTEWCMLERKYGVTTEFSYWC